jgi:ribose 5-phosphate isomerase B
MDKDQVRSKVRSVVYRTLGLARGAQPSAKRRLVTEHDIQPLPVGGHFDVPPGALVTPLARQAAMDRHVTLAEVGAVSAPSRAEFGVVRAGAPGGQVIALGADHGGFQLKEVLKGDLTQQGYALIDCGTRSTDAVDYPDFALAVAELVAQGKAWRGIVIDGAGTGSCMAANKVPGVRAAMCYDHATSVNSREHNDANVLTLGAGLLGENLARQIVKTWLETSFGGGRHARRVEKIADIERRYLKMR